MPPRARITSPAVSRGTRFDERGGCAQELTGAPETVDCVAGSERTVCARGRSGRGFCGSFLARRRRFGGRGGFGGLALGLCLALVEPIFVALGGFAPQLVGLFLVALAELDARLLSRPLQFFCLPHIFKLP